MCLAAHPHKQALVVRELQQLGLVASPSQPEPRTLVADDIPKLQYLDAVRPPCCARGYFVLGPVLTPHIMSCFCTWQRGLPRFLKAACC